MNTREDAFGQALLDKYTRGGGPAVIERDDGLVECDCLAPYFSGPGQWPPLARRLLRHARGRVLDVGAGAGRHALYLQSKGLAVTAIDISPSAIKLCRVRGVRRARVVALEQVQRLAQTFDTVIMFGNNFGLLGGFRKARRLLKRMAACTSDRAQILSENVDPYKTSNPLHRAYHRRNRRRGRMGGQLRLRVRYKQYATAWFDYLFVSQPELRQILHGTGWAIGEILCDDRPTYYVRIVKMNATAARAC